MPSESITAKSYYGMKFDPANEKCRIPYVHEAGGTGEEDDYANPADTIFPMTLSTPLWATGWGYDTNGNILTEEKTGPIDVRWDDTRKVWTSTSSDISTTVVTVTGNDASDATYTYSGGTIIHWQEWALGLTGHRLESGDKLISFSFGGSRYGISGYALGKSS